MSADAVASVERWHGTDNGYVRHRCRCDDCRAANAARARIQYAKSPRVRSDAERARMKEQRKRRFEQGLPDPNDTRHGTLNGYSSWGCRCTRCTAALRVYANRRRQAKRHER